MALAPNVSNYSVFQGSVTFTPDGGSLTDIGDVSQFRYSADLTPLDHFTHHAGIRAKDKSVVIQSAATISMVCDEVNDFNLSLYLLADSGTAEMGGLTNTDLTGTLVFTGTNTIGNQVSLSCKCQFKPGGNLDLIAQGNDWSTIPLTADVLFDSGAYGQWSVTGATA